MKGEANKRGEDLEVKKREKGLGIREIVEMNK